MKNFISFLCICSIFSLFAFTPKNDVETSSSLTTFSTELILGDEGSDAFFSDCCGTITITNPVCNTNNVTFSYYLVGSGATVNLNAGSNYVTVCRGAKYTLSYTATSPVPLSCFPASASYNLCGNTGIAVLDPSAKVSAGKDPKFPCFGF